MKFFISFILLLLSSLPGIAGGSKSLTAIVPKAGLSSTEYKSLESFAKKLGQEINLNWFPASYQNNLRTVVRIPLNNVKSFELKENSGYQDFDQTCLMAIERSEGLINYPSNKYIEFLFEYKYREIKVPTTSFFRWPAQLGIGWLSRKLGMNPFVQIPIF